MFCHQHLPCSVSLVNGAEIQNVILQRTANKWQAQTRYQVCQHYFLSCPMPGNTFLCTTWQIYNIKIFHFLILRLYQIHNTEHLAPEYLTVMLLLNQVFWDILLCQWVSCSEHFGRTQSLHLQGSWSPRRITEVEKV